MIIETLNRFWTDLLGFSAQFITPDWGSLIKLIPILLAIAVVGPILTLLALSWLRFGARRPHGAVRFAPVRRPAPLDAAGNPVYPSGEPYSPLEQTIYEPGATRSAAGEDLVVGCPKCGLVRGAAIGTCGNCGLSFTLKPTTRSLRPAGPPVGGSAAA